jgi:hypothetical protein
VKVGLGNKYVKLMKDKTKDNTQLGPEGCVEHLVIGRSVLQMKILQR